MLKHVFVIIPVTLLLLLLTIVQAAGHAKYPRNPVVSTVQGRVRGVQIPGTDGVPYDAFYGIPFAQPPVGRLRFAVSLFLLIFQIY